MRAAAHALSALRAARSPAAFAVDAIPGRDRGFGAYLDVGADAVFLLAGLTALWDLGRMPGWLPLVAVAMLARFFATSPRVTGPRYDPIGRHYGTLLYGVLAVWLVDAPALVQDATQVGVAVATVAALVGRTRFLRGPAGAGADRPGPPLPR